MPRRPPPGRWHRTEKTGFLLCELIGGFIVTLARSSGAAYLKDMAPPVLTQHQPVAAAPSVGVVRIAIVWGGTGLAGLAAIGALALWFHYGTTVFFEMIASGISACF
jgi:hypothetical protein